MPALYKEFIGKSTTSDELISYLRNHNKYTLPLNLVEIIEFLGIKLENDPDFEHITRLGSISKSGAVVKLWYNPIENQLETRKRFTIAHELGHFFLHFATSQEDMSDDAISFNRDDNSDKTEWGANKFAAELLMPTVDVFVQAKIIIHSYKETTGRATQMPKDEFIEKMAKFFIVSQSAMEYRLSALGVL